MKICKTYPTYVLERFRQLHSEGYSDRQISEVMPELSSAQVAGELRRRLGLPPNMGRNGVDLTPRILELYEKGMNDAEIGAALHRSAASIARKRSILGLRPNRSHKASAGCSKRCRSCGFCAAEFGLYCCDYLLITGKRRPCEAGDGCTVYQPRRRLRA